MNVSQNCVCSTRPPGVGEQQVLVIVVVFSHEKNEGSDMQPEIMGKVFGTETWPGNGEPAFTTAAKQVNNVNFETVDIVEAPN